MKTDYLRSEPTWTHQTINWSKLISAIVKNPIGLIFWTKNQMCYKVCHVLIRISYLSIICMIAKINLTCSTWKPRKIYMRFLSILELCWKSAANLIKTLQVIFNQTVVWMRDAYLLVLMTNFSFLKFFYKFGSFTSPGDIYYCSLDSKENYEPKVWLVFGIDFS